ncbi:interleukin-3 receptor subunit alpha isoform X1 [Elephas maximus indicus]|uniref:interleukin-3 receptor subunit alpha isoform X1 n=1 Tax=Elephas maximus indicus TaxID=99487 RepID=UPI0021167B01|nr:interleukin-3 receptor subunit alpha isoform X1 [Elephas maximus indicus]
MSFVWLAVFLTPVGSLLERDPDPGAPISNIRVDPRRGRVVWDLNGSVAEVTCSTGSVYLSKADNTTTYCQFYAFLLCKTTNYTVTVTSGPPFSTVIQYPKPDGKPGAAAENLTCWIHDVDFLECSWAVGKAAPWDVQYHLYLIETPNYEEWACGHYTTDMRGIHTGCHFDNISRLKNHHHHFVVNGTSEGFIIPCTEIFATLSEIEILAPPSLSGRCNKSYSLMEWNMSSHFIWDFIYELQIQKGTDPTHLNTPIVTDKNSHELVNPGTYVARIRAKNNFGNTWSGWSPPRSFECDKDGSLGIWPATLSIALGTLLTILLVVLLCRRFSVIQKIFPPIPQMKDPVKDFFQNDRLVRGLLSSALGVSGDRGWCLPAQGRLWRGVSGGGCPVWMPGDPGWPCPRLAKPGAQ